MTGAWSMLRFFLRRDRWWFLWWPVGVGLLYLSQGWSVDNLYSNQAEFDQAAETMSSNPALVAMTGPARALNTTGGQVFWQAAAFGAICVGLMSMFMVGRHTRAEEENGRDELLRAAPIARFAPTLAAIKIAFLANLVVGVVTAGMLAAYGLATPDSIATGLGLTAVGWLFTGSALVAAQLTPSSRGMYGTAGAVLAVAYLLRAVGDVGDNGISWLSPIGWYQAMHPYSGLRWWPILLLLAGSAVNLAIAYVLYRRRDYGAGILAARPGPATAKFWYGTPVGLQWRLQRISVYAWAIGLFAGGLAMGSIGNSASDIMGDGELSQDFLVPGGDVTDSFYATMLLTMGLLAAAFAVSSAMRPKADEDDERLEGLLATGLSRTSYLTGGMVVTVVGAFIGVMASAIGLCIGFALVTGDGSNTAEFLLGGAQLIAPVVVLSGFARLLVAVRPRLASAAWGLLGFCAVSLFFGATLQFPTWLTKVSPFQVIAAVPADDFDPVAFGLLLLLAAAFAVLAVLAYRRRDLA